MSNKYNDQIIDMAVDNVNQAMEANPTIPEEAREMLVVDEMESLINHLECMDTEPEDWDTIDCEQGGACGVDQVGQEDY